MDLILRTKEAVKEFDNLRYRRMKKVFLDQEDRSSISASQSSVPNSSLIESNDLMMDLSNSKNNSYPILDDDDSRSTDFISDSNPTYPDEDGSLNSSQSSLAHPSSSSNLSNKQMSNFESNFVQKLNVDPSCFQPLQIEVDPQEDFRRQDVKFERFLRQDEHFFVENFQSNVSDNSAIHFGFHPINSGQMNEFSTIKTSRIVCREQRQYEQDDQQREQFRGYKQMRRQHQKQLKQVADFEKFFSSGKEKQKFFLSSKNDVESRNKNSGRNSNASTTSFKNRSPWKINASWRNIEKNWPIERNTIKII